MKIKERLKLMKEVEGRNRKRIKEFIENARKGGFNGFRKKTDEYRGDEAKRK